MLLEASLNGFRFEQVPITFYKRKSGKSFISPIYPFKVIPQLILIFCIMKPMRTFGRIGLISFLIGSFIGIYQLYLFFKGINPKPVMNVNLISMLLLFGIQLFSVGVLGQIIIDKKSSFFMQGTELDFNDGLLDRGFVFNNPEATGSCGCGTSFSV